MPPVLHPEGLRNQRWQSGPARCVKGCVTTGPCRPVRAGHWDRTPSPPYAPWAIRLGERRPSGSLATHTRPVTYNDEDPDSVGLSPGLHAWHICWSAARSRCSGFCAPGRIRTCAHGSGVIVPIEPRIPSDLRCSWSVVLGGQALCRSCVARARRARHCADTGRSPRVGELPLGTVGPETASSRSNSDVCASLGCWASRLR